MSAGRSTLFGMVRELPATLRYLAQQQHGVVSRAQAMKAGLSPGMIKFRIRSGRWRQLHPGIYATFTGTPGHGAWLWAAVLAAGPGAVLSHQTAAELQGLADKAVSTIHVTISATTGTWSGPTACPSPGGRFRSRRRTVGGDDATAYMRSTAWSSNSTGG